MNTDEARKQWELAAPGWAKWEDVFSSAVVSVTNMMLDTAGVTKGKHVLDLASGAGNQSIAAAQRVGPSGHVVANDISKTMLHHVDQNATAANLSNISTLLGAVQDLEIAPNTFDAVICRFALMLFAEPAIVLAKARQVLKPNGKIGVAVLSTPQANPFFVKPMQILLHHAGKSPSPGGPGLFALGAPSALKNLFEVNHFVNVEICYLNLAFQMPSATQTLMMIQEAFGAYRAVIDDSPESVQRAAWNEVLEYLGSTLRHDG